MDSKGHILEIDGDRVLSRSHSPVPNLGRGHLVLAALDAGIVAGWPEWWPELAPLRREERMFVRAQAEESRR
jgi:hypothetical protein